MKKSILLFVAVMSACASLYAGEKEYVGDKTINVLQGYTTMEMDMVSYGNTVYEAFLGMNHTDLDKGTPIFINKFIDNINGVLSVKGIKLCFIRPLVFEAVGFVGHHPVILDPEECKAVV